MNNDRESALITGRFLDRLLFNLSDAVMITGRDTTIIRVNRAFEELFGWRQAELAQMNYSSYVFVPESLRHESEMIYRNMLESGKVSNIISRRVCKNGTEVDVSISFSNIDDGQGQLIGMIAIYRDITDSKVKEMKMEESRQRYMSLFEHNPDAVFATDSEGRFQSFNRKTLDIAGYSIEELEGMPFHSFIHPDDLPRAIEGFGKAMAGSVQTEELRIADRRRSGIYLYMSITSLPIYVNGEIEGVYGIAQNISHLKQASMELEESNERYKSLFDHHPDAVFTIDLEGRFQTFNDNTIEVTGYSREELQNLPFAPVIHPEDLSRVNEHFEKAIRGDVQKYELRAIRKGDTDYSVISVTNIPIYIDGEVRGVYGIAKVITELKRAREELMQSAERHRQLVEIIPDPLIVIAADKLQYINRAGVECLGLDKETDVRNYTFIDLVHPDSWGEARMVIDTIQVTGEFKGSKELIFRRKDGTPFYAEISGIRLEDHTSPGSLMIFRDITKRKKTEETIQFLAYHDSLTSLPNRVRFHQLVESGNQENRCGGMVFLDLDRFKIINDTLGHRTGDFLLQEVSRRLRQMVGGIFSRLGGDEFTGYFPNADRESMKQIVAEMNLLLSRPYRIEGHELSVSSSIGISLYPNDSKEVDILLQQADTALYEAKKNGGNGYAFYKAKQKV
ncbi:PAS domain S-box protein [Paenibacillus chartarius]|uniref:PAS domain S-box protein n=1 Tax=Paenibacillus chartarius TaxID=747481 RepID=A0ABV6DLT4_9BACL